MTQATPGPWRVHKHFPHIIVPDGHETRGIGGSIYEDDDRERFALEIAQARCDIHSGFAHEISEAEARANAAMIVRAVNDRPELIAALETTIGNLMNVQIDLSTGGTKAKADKSLSEIITRARAILEKAKAQ